MSRAFVKETDAIDELPDRIVSDYPNYVTVEGLDLIERTIVELQSRLAQAQIQGDRNALAAISRDLRYWDNRRSTAMVVQMPDSAATVRFGAMVTIKRDDGRTQGYRIVGEDEADPSKGLLSHASPLAQALLGKAVGDTVRAGQGEAEILAIGEPSATSER
ncbi:MULTISPECIES: transcription elongation factor GreA [unclassified Afipia]|uniref:transcription elongation factor GreA n=1 Tax=unclassified Afipia TaxID=2642050 RepID=UPI00040C7EF5|nr:MULTISPECIES: transcription elongation factor GreA [unclassified Afipia]